MRTARSISAASALVALLALAVSGCGDDSSPGPGNADVTAVATTTQVGDLVREVGGDRVAVEQILQPNSDPHGYEPRPSDVKALAAADAIVQSGGELDEWLGDVIDNSGADAPRVELIQAVERIDGEPGAAGEGEHAGEEEHDHGDSADPHWWQDPRNAIAAVAAIRDALIAADPGGRAEYEANARAYTERLRRLDRNVAACIDAIPAPQRKLVTTHDALGYYAHRYDLDVVGALIPSQSTAAQPSAGDTQRLVEQIERENVRAIFPESSLDPKLERAVARETGATVGRALWADTLGSEDSDGATYVESIQANTAALVDGLTGGAKQCRPEA
ncbi:MAG TPA: metal ABC transporter substrate-binding protein [Thermoleophilaceae bacterium]|nr:metal ABC transporter substrate-binding protein [Thermoleophilaceae bacterium]